ncbi:MULTISPECIES: hypothetical protein [Pseudobacillus]|uniref:hypothetical protein n=1 Tax=Pseudobacillus TaxID=108525 RepID=UPI003879281E
MEKKRFSSKQIQIAALVSFCVSAGLLILFGVYSYLNEDTHEKEQGKVAAETVDKETRKVVFDAYATSRGSGIYIEKTELGDDYAVLDYYKSYKEFKEGVDATNITEKQYKEHWTGYDRYKRMPLEDSVFLFLEYPELQDVQINYAFGNVKFKANVDRTRLEKFLNLKFPKKRDAVWEEKSLGVIYDLKTVNKFSKEFVNAKK